MTPEQSRELRRLAKAHRIFFVNNPAPPHTWPESHRDTFLNIRRIGDFRFDQYGETVDIHTNAKPWRNETKRRAARLSGLAAQCQRERRNEAGWRLLIEPEVFARFTVEVVCQKCRARLWRSEIEAPLPSCKERSSGLAERRENREPCQCHPSSRADDCLDTGISPIFSDRAEEMILHDKLLRSDLIRKEKPDRVYGLQHTKNFERALEAPFAHDGEIKSVRESIAYSPFADDGGHPLLFPFLIAEAKSEKGCDSSSSIETQTMFPIKTLLKLQAALQEKLEKPVELSGGPLVWFVSYKGQDWRVYSCYIDSGEIPAFKILHLWSGCITFTDDALQLLLIMDYIFDWARDIYRPSILRQLRLLSTEDVSEFATIDHDSDIFSLKNAIPSWIPEPDTCGDAIIKTEAKPSDDYLASSSVIMLDQCHGVVRRVGNVESRLLGVYITADNVSTLLQSDESPAASFRTAKKILGALSKGSLALSSEEVLNVLEDKWTGNFRGPTNPFNQSRRIYMKFTITHFINAQWDLCRELNYLAVSEDGLEALLEHSMLPWKVAASRYALTADQNDLEYICDDVQQSSSEQCLLACLFNVLLVLDADKTAKAPKSSRLRLCAAKRLFSRGNADSIREIVQSVYQKNKIGRREPSESFLRHSSGIRTAVDVDKRHSQVLDSVLQEHGPLRQPEPGTVLVYGRCPPQILHKTAGPRLCLYITDEGREVSPDIVLNTLFSLLNQCEQVYYTRREEYHRVTHVFKKDLSLLDVGLVSKTEDLSDGAGSTYTFTIERLLLLWVTAMAQKVDGKLDRDVTQAIEAVPKLDVEGMSTSNGTLEVIDLLSDDD